MKANAAVRDGGGLELISKADAVLRLLDRHRACTAPDISAAVAEPLSSVYRLLQSLTAIGWVERGPRRGTYRLGLPIMTVGGRIADDVDIRRAALPAMRRLVQITGATTYLCVRRDVRAVCVERLEGYAVRSLYMQLGDSLPLYAGAAPRALLAYSGPAVHEAVIADSAAAGPAMDPAKPGAAAIRADIATVCREGYSVSDEDVTPGIGSLGVPIFDHRGALAAALSISGLRPQVLGADRPANTQRLLEAGLEISISLGYDGGAR